MRGTVAKELRKYATGITPDGDEVLDRVLYKKLKRSRNTGQDPKLPKRTRWERSELHRAKMSPNPYPLRFRPIQSIGKFYGDLTEQGRSIALNLARRSGRLAKPDLLHAVASIKGNRELYADIEPDQPQPV